MELSTKGVILTMADLSYSPVHSAMFFLDNSCPKNATRIIGLHRCRT